MTSRAIAAPLICICLYACSGRTPSSPSAAPSHTPFPGVTVPISTAPQTPEVTGTAGNITPILSAATPEPLDRPLYRIRAALDTEILSTENGEMMVLLVQEEVTYTHHAPEPVQDLVLQFEPSRRQELFSLSELSSDRAARGGRAEILDGQLRISLENPLAPGESAVVRLEYRRFIPREPALIGWNDYQILLGNWYAFYPPYRDGEGWLAHPPGQVGEHLSFPYADFDVELQIVGGGSYQVAASGIPDGGTTPLHYQFTGRSFAVALTRQTLFSRTAGPVEVLAYARPDHEAQGNFMADTAARAMTLYSEILGEYPHRRLTVLESELEDGMEFDGLVFLSPALFEYFTGDGQDYLTAITAHETAHEWWYGRAGNDQADDPWIDEAFAAYSELLFYEKYYPGNLDWWWWTRVNRYPSTYCIDQSIYAFPDFRTYVNTVYLRGATMLHELRNIMGKAAFLESLRELQTSGYGSILAPADVFRVFQAHSTAGLGSVWKEYVCQPVAAEGT
jgi:hypothetical protein